MKYLKSAFLGLAGAALMFSCTDKTPVYGPGEATVEFEESQLTISETGGLQTLNLKLNGGEPGGWPVTVTIEAEVVDGPENLSDILAISGRNGNTVKINISEENDSFVQLHPINHPDVDENYEVKLTITAANGAAIGTKKECTVTIENRYAVRTGMYILKGGTGSNPAESVVTLRFGRDGEYILDNLGDNQYSPSLLGTLVEETNAQGVVTSRYLMFDGRVNGKNGNMLGSLGGYIMNNDFLIYLQSESSEYPGSASAPIKIAVNDEWELSSMSNTFIIFKFNLAFVDGDLVPDFDNPENLAAIGGSSTFEHFGDAEEEEWPF